MITITPTSLSIKRSGTFTLYSNYDNTLLFRIKSNHYIPTPTFGKLSPSEQKRIKLTTRSRTPEQIIIEVIEFIDDQLEIEDSVQFWKEKPQAKLKKQTLQLEIQCSDTSSQGSSAQKFYEQNHIHSQPTQGYQPPPLIEDVQQFQHLQQFEGSQIEGQDNKNNNNNNNSNILGASNRQQFSQQTFSRINNEEMQSRRISKQKSIEKQIDYLDYQSEQQLSQVSSHKQLLIPQQFEKEKTTPFYQRGSQLSINSNIISKTIENQPHYHQSEGQDKLKQKEQQLQKQIDQLKVNKEQLAKDLQQLEFKAMFKTNENNGKSQQNILIWHLLLTSVAGLVFGATIKKILTIF